VTLQRFADRVALITGAASGIGEACARRLTAEGAMVWCTDVAPSVEAVADGLDGAGWSFCDVSDPVQVQAAVDATLDRFGRLDVLVNSAGILLFENSHETTLDQWNRILAVNLTGTFLCSMAALSHLLDGGGSIVNISSSAAVKGAPWAAAYAASKGGVLSLTRSLAIEYGRQGLRVNALCPSNVATPIRDEFRFPQDVDQSLLHRLLPFHEEGYPADVAAAVAFLASDDGRHVNGAELRVDGGDLT
jgi:meso-butanediol dehydrogenase/(S,S)-butanediol dehydrogenase/diacetyl reductase